MTPFVASFRMLRIGGLSSGATLTALPWIVGGCAPPSLYAPSPGEIPALEARAEQTPGDAETQALLGAAYREAGRLDEAGEALEHALEIDPTSEPGLFFLGLTYEDLGRFAEARDAYRRYLGVAPSGPLSERIEDRVVLLRQRLLEAAVVEAVAREQELTANAPDASTVAVFPFLADAVPDRLAPLGMALAGMVTTDLAESGRLTVLERVQIRTLLEEIALGEAGSVDPGTAARGGRILGAGRIVQGEVGGTETELRLDAAVVDALNVEEGVARVSRQDALERFFELEKALVFEVFDAMGVTLTVAERERISQRRTENLAAVLAYGRGLEASFAGDPGAAANHFAEAARLDPGFAQAATEARSAQAVAAASGSDTGDLVRDVEATLDLGQEVVEAVEEAATWNPAREGPVDATGVVVILRRPSGGEER